MATKRKSSQGNAKGFGSMDQDRQRELASQGGRASAQSNTTNRGFASMDKKKQKEISRLGGKASQSRNQRGSTGRNEQEPSALHDGIHKVPIITQEDIKRNDLSSRVEEREVADEGLKQASYSETDEDENEGLGDGNMGRSKKSKGFDEEG